jgi:hypothetical protein
VEHVNPLDEYDDYGNQCHQFRPIVFSLSIRDSITYPNTSLYDSIRHQCANYRTGIVRH